MTHVTGKPIPLAKWTNKYSKARNWLLIWRMQEKRFTIPRLSEASGITISTIQRLIARPGSVPDEDTMRKLCQALKANPVDLGWAKRLTPVGTAYRVDLTTLKDILDNYIKGMIMITSQLQAMSDKVDNMYMDYVDHLKDEGKCHIVDGDIIPVDEEKVNEVVGDTEDINDWDVINEETIHADN